MDEQSGNPARDQGSLQSAIMALQQYVSDRIVGQATLVNRLLVALLADGHLLVEGAPGLAKTRADLKKQFAQMRGAVDARAFVQALRKQYKITVAEDRL